MQILIGQSGTFQGIIDLIRGVAIYYNLKDEKDKGKSQVEKPIPPEEKERYEVARRPRREGRRAGRHADREVPQRRGADREGDPAAPEGHDRLQCHPSFTGSALKYVGVQRCWTASWTTCPAR